MSQVITNTSADTNNIMSTKSEKKYKAIVSSQSDNINLDNNKNITNQKLSKELKTAQNLSKAKQQSVPKVRISPPDNNSNELEGEKKKISPCTCWYSQSNSCALKHRFGVRIHSDFSDERTSAKSKHDKVTFCDKDISTPGRPRQSSPTTYSEIIILDSPPAGHWPLKRSASLESRDNPFLPGGDLEKEADDILKRATIVRDRFFLEGQKQVTSENVTVSETSPLNTENAVVEESIAPQTAESMNCEPNAKPRQNGKVEDSSVSPTSKKPEVGHDTPDGVTTVTDDTSKDKKKQKKCCNVM